MTKPALMVLKDITKSFKNGPETLQVLKGIDLSVEEGDFVAIMGPSGSGKSTLMNIIGLLDRPTSGSYQLEDEDVAELSENRLAKVRNNQIGFIFQQFMLENLRVNVSKKRNNSWKKSVCLTVAITYHQSYRVDRSRGWQLRVPCLIIQQSF